MRVLIVEDEARLVTYLRRGLEAEAYAVDVAADGEQGLWMATNEPYDAIVLDIMLPAMNGYRVCAELRRRGVWTPILMLTAKSGELDEAEALDTGADDFLTKPFSFAVLLARLRSLTRRVPTERPATIEVGPLVLDPAAHRCHVDGTEIALTPTEFCLLHQLVRRPGDVVSKAAILGSLLGLGVRRRPQHRGGVRQPPAPQDRRPARTYLHRDGARPRLSLEGR